MNITKIKHKEGRTHIEYNKMRPDGNMDEFVLKSHDAPKPSFVDAWDLMATCILEEAELTDLDPSTIKPLGVTISYYDDGRWGAVLTGTRQLERSNAPMVMNTPHKPAEPTQGNEHDISLLSDCTAEAILTLTQEAEAFIKGDRAQISMDFEKVA